MKPGLKELVTAPIGQGALTMPTAAASGENPVCGDRLTFELRVDGANVEELAFRATACPACIAVASCAVSVLVDHRMPESPPFERLRDEVDRRGGLSRFEQHAIALVEDVLRRAFASARAKRTS
ncbi:MAG: iron-sulfur cluster assembly scaffold protein [Planctomycetota bacterium]|nr:iron-sulfur cluster assembly scaffold protein [Planctomycetota bacterium]